MCLLLYFFFLSFVLKTPFLSVLLLFKFKTCPLLLDLTLFLDAHTSSRRYSASFPNFRVYLGIGYKVVLERGMGHLGDHIPR